MQPIYRFLMQMLLVGILISLFFSCASKKANCDAYGQAKAIKNTARKQTLLFTLQEGAEVTAGSFLFTEKIFKNGKDRDISK